MKWEEKNTMAENKVSFENLSGWLKVLVIYGWVMFIISVLSFIAGFITGYLGL